MAFSQTIVAGNDAPGSRDGDRFEARFNNPNGIAINPRNGAIIVADTDNHCIRQIMDGVVSTIAGIGTRRLGDTGTGRIMGADFADGPDSMARFHSPRGVVVSLDGDIYVADCENHRIRRIMGGDVDTFAGNDRSQTTNGVGAAASFQSPCNLAFGRDDTLYVTDSQSDSIRMIDREGVVATLAGAALRGEENGRGTDARFREPTGIATNAAGVVFVADRGNCRIRRITNGVVDTLAGTGDEGGRDGAGATAEFRGPTGLTFHPTTSKLFVIDTRGTGTGTFIRTVDTLTGVVTTLTRVDIPGIVKGIVVNREGAIFLTVGNKIVAVLPPQVAGRRSARRYKSRRSRRSKRSRQSKRTRKN
jgi:DNA-binding beta-propeller fold protein YncE